MPGELELLMRLLLACALGGAVGLERELSAHGAGFRTHILVALGCCLFTVVSAYGFAPFVPGTGAGRFDPTRIAAQVVSGIGFLGGGAILRSGFGVHGLTTAASLWVVAAIGLAAGAGFYAGAAVTAVLAIAALWGLKRVSRRLIEDLRGSQVELSLKTGAEMELAALVETLGRLAVSVERLRVDREGGARTITVGVQLPADRRAEEVVHAVGQVPGVSQVEWSR